MRSVHRREAAELGFSDIIGDLSPKLSSLRVRVLQKDIEVERYSSLILPNNSVILFCITL